MATTTPTSFRLSDEAKDQIERLRDHYATLAPTRPSAADVVEQALARLAESLLGRNGRAPSGKPRKS